VRNPALRKKEGVMKLKLSVFLGNVGSCSDRFCSTYGKPYSITELFARVATINPVGAGDAFIGGFLAAYDKFGTDNEKLYSWAAAASACTAQSKGLLWPPDMFNEILKRVSIEIE
jgi:fructose-1-phosphate kinase PfkB-like protein